MTLKIQDAPQRSRNGYNNRARMTMREFAKIALKLKPGKAVQFPKATITGGWTAMLLGLSLGSGRTFRTYTAANGKVYVTVD